VGLLAGAVVLYAARRSLAEDAVSAWLRDHGVEGETQVLSLGLDSVTGRVRIGDAAHPDLIIDHLKIGYSVKGLGLEVRSITLVRPRLRARLHDGRFSAGALDPLIAEFEKRPPAKVQPRIVLQDAAVALATDAGPVTLHGDGQLDDGRLTRLVARSDPARLAIAGGSAELGVAQLSLQSRGGGIEVTLEAPIAAAAMHDAKLENGHIRLAATLPYPDAARRRAAGPVVAHAELTAARLSAPGQALQNALLSSALTGQASGWIEDFALDGRAVADLRVSGGQAAGGGAGPLRAALSAQNLKWTRRGGDVVSADISATGLADSYRLQDLQFSQVGVAAHGPVRLSRKDVQLRLQASAEGRGSWRGLDGVKTGAADDIAAVTRAARAFRFAAPGVELAFANGRTAARPTQPMRLVPDSGGAVTLTPRGSGWRLTSAGGGLPKATVDADRLVLAKDGASAHVRAQAAISLGPVQHGLLDAAGMVRAQGATASFTAERCASFDVAGMAFGTNQLRRVAGQLCPTGRPLLGVQTGGWRVAAQLRGGAAELPVLQARLAGVAGAIDVSGVRAGLAGRVTLDAATVTDTAAARRFSPATVSGAADLATGLWRGDLQVRDAAGRSLAQLAFRQDPASGHGAMEVSTGTLQFAPGGLQPAEISPLAAMVGSPAGGEASFQGRFDWTPKRVTSSGALDVARFDFVSPIGKVSGLAGHVLFTSLAPLVTAPGQTLRAAEIAAPIAPLRDVSLDFSLQPTTLQVANAEVSVGGGRARVQGLVAPLAGAGPIRGVVDLDGVQLHDLVEASPFGDRVDLDAKVSGRIPIEAEGTKLRVTGGALHAVQPGRLTIQLADATPAGAPAAPATPAAATPLQADTFTDFAYQAMEDLHFTTLEAAVDSRPDGRLGVLFHIVGEHDPPQHQEIRLTLFDLIGRKFLNRRLPLPSGTGVNLTLDTTLNLDDLLSDYADFRRLQGSAQVQPPAVKTEP
jgi:hypothetical protein